MRNLIIFDFDGVLVDSFKFWFAVNKTAASKLGKHLTKEKYLKSFFGNLHDGLKRILKLNPKEAIEFSQEKSSLVKSLYNSKSVILFKFTPKLIRKLSKNYDLAIVTSSPEPAVRSLLKQKGLDRHFVKIFGLNEFGKRHALKILLKNYSKKKAVFITDTVGDILEAQAVGLSSIAVTWGFHKFKELKKAKPNKIISKPDQFKHLFE